MTEIIFIWIAVVTLGTVVQWYAQIQLNKALVEWTKSIERSVRELENRK